MSSPLVDYVYWGKEVPFLSQSPRYDYRALVLPAHCKTGLVTSRLSGKAHLCAGLAAVIHDGRVIYGARYMCYRGTPDAVIIPSAEPYGGVCTWCEDAAQGPGVYRCLNAMQEVIYIGSSEKPLMRCEKGHKARASWWPEVADIQIVRYPTIFEARGAERLAIHAERPLRNDRRQTRLGVA